MNKFPKHLIQCGQLKRNYCKSLIYTQGQVVDSKIREYFYYIDHDGMLYLDDTRMKNFTSCFKDKKFLRFFYRRLKFNQTERYRCEFPYLSLCGLERNYIRCDDLPIVFTNVMTTPNDEKPLLSFAHADQELQVEFQPHKIYMSPKNGRVYHPAHKQYGSIGLIRSKMAIEISKFFEFRNGEHAPPTHFTWQDVQYELEADWLHDIQLPESRECL